MFFEEIISCTFHIYIWYEYTKKQIPNAIPMPKESSEPSKIFMIVIIPKIKLINPRIKDGFSGISFLSKSLSV